MVAPYVNPLINFLPISNAFDSINDVAATREKIRAQVEAGQRDNARLDLDRQRAADARTILDIERRMKEDELGYRGTQRELTRRAMEADEALKRAQARAVGQKPVDPFDEWLMKKLDGGGNPLTPGTSVQGQSPGGPERPEGIGGTSFGGPADDSLSKVPGVVVTPLAAPERAPQGILGINRPPVMTPAGADRPLVGTQQDVVDQPGNRGSAPQSQRDNSNDPIVQTPFGPYTASALDKFIAALELKNKKGLADHLKLLRDEAVKGPNFDKLPEYAAKSAAFATRMIDAEKNVRDIMSDPKGGFDPTGTAATVVRAVESLPFVPEGASNLLLRGTGHQKYMQAAEQWIRAFLRKESGAAIGKDEFVRDFKVYFPQPGDSKELVEQKAQARTRAMQGFTGETRGFHKHVDPRGHDTLTNWLQSIDQSELDARQKRAIVEAARRENPRITPTELDRIVKERMGSGPPTKGRARMPQPEQQRVKVNSPDEARRLPSGTPIELPDGRQGVVP